MNFSSIYSGENARESSEKLTSIYEVHQNITKKATGAILLLAARALVHFASVRAAITAGEIVHGVSSVGVVAD